MVAVSPLRRARGHKLHTEGSLRVLHVSSLWQEARRMHLIVMVCDVHHPKRARNLVAKHVIGHWLPQDNHPGQQRDGEDRASGGQSFVAQQQIHKEARGVWHATLEKRGGSKAFRMDKSKTALLPPLLTRGGMVGGGGPLSTFLLLRGVCLMRRLVTCDLWTDRQQHRGKTRVCGAQGEAHFVSPASATMHLKRMSEAMPSSVRGCPPSGSPDPAHRVARRWVFFLSLQPRESPARKPTSQLRTHYGWRLWLAF